MSKKATLNALVTLVCTTLLALKGHKTVSQDLLARTNKTAEELWPGVQEAQKRSLVTIQGQVIKLTPAGVEASKATQGHESAKAEAPAPQAETFPQKMARLKREKREREQAAQAQPDAQAGMTQAAPRGNKRAGQAPKGEAQAPAAPASDITTTAVNELSEAQLRERLAACQAEITLLGASKPLVRESLTRMTWKYQGQLRKRFGA
jgi:hypothetical protein